MQFCELLYFLHLVLPWQLVQQAAPEEQVPAQLQQLLQQAALEEQVPAQLRPCRLPLLRQVANLGPVRPRLGEYRPCTSLLRLLCAGLQRRLPRLVPRGRLRLSP